MNQEEEVVTRVELDAASALLEEAQRIIIVTHLSPDGDAIGSMVGLGLALRSVGKQITLCVDDGVPRNFRFLNGTEDVLGKLENPRADLIIVTDCSSIDRTGKCGEAAFALDVPSIVIDHHPTNTFFGTAHIVHSPYVSSTEGVLEWLDYLEIELTQDIAAALLTGLITDTISFRVGPVTSETFSIAQRLMAYGIDLRRINQQTLLRTTSGMIPLIGRGLARAILEDNVIWTSVTQQDFKDFGFTNSQRPELSSDLLKDENAYIAAVFQETEDGDIRVSLRAVPGFDVAQIAFSLGGGGHVLAAGCTVPGSTVEEAAEKVVPLLKEEARRGTPVY